MKKRTRTLLLLSAMLIVALIVNVNAVNAANEQDETTQASVEIDLSKMPDTIEAGIPTTEATNFETGMNEKLESKVIQVLKEATSSDIEEQYNVYVYFATHTSNESLTDLSKIVVSLTGKTTHQEVTEKVVTVKYTDANWNENDQKYMENKYKTVGELEIKGLEIDIDDAFYNPKDLDNYTGFEILEKNMCKTYEGYINDAKIKCTDFYTTKASWGWPEYYLRGSLELATNGVAYYRIATLIHATPMITIPDNIEDTEDAYIAYAKQKMVQRLDWVESEESVEITKGTQQDEYLLWGETTILLKKAKKVENVEPSKPQTEVVSKENADTKIKLDTTSNMVSANVVLDTTPITQGDVFNKIKSALDKDMKFIAFDITLKVDDEKIQPSGKVKISIPIPSEFNKENLVVYRIEDNGNKIEYDVTVEGEYATFETDHFSFYVLAEASNVAVERKLDSDEPKTGEENYVLFASVMAVISLAGMMMIKKHK